MSIEFECDACQKQYRVKDELAGKSAKCTCGARITIPELAPEPMLEQDDLFAELSQPVVSAPAAAATPADVGEELKKSVYALTGNRTLTMADRWLKGNLPAIGKLAVGAVVGMFFGLKSLPDVQGGKVFSPTERIAIIGGAGVLGALAASLLLVADIVRKRKAAGTRIPLVLRLYFASGIVSMLLWIATAFLGAIVLAAVLINGGF